MTCHNRRELTLRCLKSLAEQPCFRPENLFLVDDGSSDGTGDAVTAMLPAAHVIEGNGHLFWNGGMRLAWEAALAAPAEFTHYQWLNDDVVLHSGALSALLTDASAVMPADGAVILVGATVDPDSGELTYGGQRASKRSRPLRLKVVAPTGTPEPVQTVSGNVVLVSAAAARRLGNLDPMFEHIYGDLDYGFRAGAAGIPIYQASVVVGTCSGPSPITDTRGTPQGRWGRIRAKLRADKTVHGRDWRRFLRRHSGLGPLWWLYTLSPYVRLLR
jgi:GT2 family glycosyltransferase